MTQNIVGTDLHPEKGRMWRKDRGMINMMKNERQRRAGREGILPGVMQPAFRFQL